VRVIALHPAYHTTDLTPDQITNLTQADRETEAEMLAVALKLGFKDSQA